MLVNARYPLVPWPHARRPFSQQLKGKTDGVVNVGAVSSGAAEDAIHADPGIQTRACQCLSQVGADTAQKQGDVLLSQAVLEPFKKVQETSVRVPRLLEDQDDHKYLPSCCLLNSDEVPV